jgi:hypothetical protein
MSRCGLPTESKPRKLLKKDGTLIAEALLEERVLI